MSPKTESQPTSHRPLRRAANKDSAAANGNPESWAALILNRRPRLVEALSLALIFLSAIILSLETLSDLSPDFQTTLRIAEFIIAVLFSVEYVLRLAANWRYVFSGWGIVDFVAIAPFYVIMFVPGVPEGSQVLRTFRLVRVFRIAKFGKVGDTAHALSKSLSDLKVELLISCGGAAMMIYVSSIFVYFAERTAQPDKFESVLHAMWWSVATLTTVGYGDIYPETVVGKLGAVAAMVFGIGLFGAFSGIMTKVMFDVARQLDRNGNTNFPALSPPESEL